jgi:hypothetical protein
VPPFTAALEAEGLLEVASHAAVDELATALAAGTGDTSPSSLPTDGAGSWRGMVRGMK